MSTRRPGPSNPAATAPVAVRVAVWGARLQALAVLLFAPAVLVLDWRWLQHDAYVADPWTPVVLLGVVVLAALGLALFRLAARIETGHRLALVALVVVDAAIVVACLSFVVKNVLDQGEGAWIARRWLALGVSAIPLVTLLAAMSPSPWRWTGRPARPAGHA